MKKKSTSKQIGNTSRKAKSTAPYRKAALAATPDPDKAALECIQIQTGSESLDPSQQLGKAGVKGGALATCVNGKLGTSFTGADFPPDMTLGDCLDKIRSP
jgi:hypothetical protein